MAPLMGGGALDPAQRRQAEHITFQLQNAWEIYVRNFILSSATGRASGLGGLVPASVPSAYRKREAVSHYLLQVTRQRFEPKWYRPSDAINAARRLNIANVANVAAAIGSTPWPLENLRLTRNFFAHRSRSSALELRALNWFGPGDTIKVETTVFPFGAGGVRRFDAWCAAMKVVSRAML
ncbi:hypothetical protein [Novosphingobium sp. P6W]|uniref:hypothetical protein n=1 Tax=Novosphingobium sp. P6W TaxID=1609758 RepID=UPI0013B3BB5B|nr:hypothetical protein [Novosphingobium sp. P6W]